MFSSYVGCSDVTKPRRCLVWLLNVNKQWGYMQSTLRTSTSAVPHTRWRTTATTENSMTSSLSPMHSLDAMSKFAVSKCSLKNWIYWVDLQREVLVENICQFVAWCVFQSYNDAVKSSGVVVIGHHRPGLLWKCQSSRFDGSLVILAAPRRAGHVAI